MKCLRALFFLLAAVLSLENERQCEDGGVCSWAEPDLKPFTFDLGGEKETFYAYVTPDVSTFYNLTAGSIPAAQTLHPAVYKKFINLSPDPVVLTLDTGRGKGATFEGILPFDPFGLAVSPGVVHIVQNSSNPKQILQRTLSREDETIIFYDPFDGSFEKAAAVLTTEQIRHYQRQYENKEFAKQYLEFTGTTWKGTLRQRKPPRFPMRRADAIGETQVVETRETHFLQLPPDNILKPATSIYGPNKLERDRLLPYREESETRNLTLKAVSCSPRVFEIRNFLSQAEVDHVLDVAKKQQLEESTTRGAGETKRIKVKGRTSRQSWLGRDTDLIFDAIYRRSADLLQMDESLLRWRHEDENIYPETNVSVAETLQLVHYGPGELYGPHHDFPMPRGELENQPSRFATILFYLNDDMTGGETAFPIWHHAGEPGPLVVQPERGMAVLFYNMLPDGNYDERTWHSAEPVVQGEKWLTNLWVWDPVLEPQKAHDHYLRFLE